MLIKEFIGCALLVALCAGAEDIYNTKYDDVNLDEILTNERLLSAYIKCLMNEGHCTTDAKELKQNLPDAIAEGCTKCSEKQRLGSAQVMRYIIDHRPDEWSRLETIYDPEGTYRKAYLDSKNSSKESALEIISNSNITGPDTSTTTEKRR